MHPLMLSGLAPLPGLQHRLHRLLPARIGPGRLQITIVTLLFWGLAARWLGMDLARLPLALHSYRWLYLQVLAPSALGALALLYLTQRLVHRVRPAWLQQAWAAWAANLLLCMTGLALANGVVLLSQHHAASRITARAPGVPIESWQYRSLSESMHRLDSPQRPFHTRMRWNGACYHWSYRVMLFQMHECRQPVSQ